jgi:hypothetical protein
MDDSRIKQLAEEVLSQIRGGSASSAPADLEGRVAALEAAVRSLQTGGPASAPAHTTVVVTQPAPQPAHPALALIGPSGGGPGSPCVLEPDKPCVGSGQCRSFGH